MSDGHTTLAVDLGGTNLRTALVRSDRMEVPTTVPHGASRNAPLVVGELVRLLAGAAAGVPLAGVGISVAGTVDEHSGVVRVADNLGWRDLPLAPLLEDAIGAPVSVETDTLCGARAEARLGGGKADCCLFIAIGTGIGHAWIIDGRVWRGAAGAATMFGHLVVEPGGLPCYCGNRGCLCQYASGPVIGRALDGPQWTSVQDAATAALALAVAHALTLLNPEEVVIGGGAAGRWPDLGVLAARIEGLVHPQVRPIRLRRSALGSEANWFGAALLVVDDLGLVSEERGSRAGA